MASETTKISSARRAFADRLTTRPLLLDGAMGALLFSRGVPQRTSLDELVRRIRTGLPDPMATQVAS